MHELSLCESVVGLIEEQAEAQGFSSVVTVWLEIGELAGVENQAMHASFPAAAGGTVADGARLEIVMVPGRAFCPDCKREVHVAARFDDCPQCGHYPLDITAGEAMRIRELEVR